MPEFPDANSGRLDPTGAAKPKPPLGKRIRAYATLIAIYAAILGMAVAAIPLLRSVLRPGIPIEDRVLHLVWAAGLLLPLGFVLRYFVRVRLKTGRWRGTPEHRKQEREQRRATCSPTQGCSTRKSGWSQYAVKWATCSAMDRKLPMTHRIAACVVLAVYVIAMLAFVAIGLICIFMAFGVLDHPASFLILLVAGIATLFLPGSALVKLVRGIRAGKVGASREDLEQVRAQRSARHQREWQKPLRSKIIGTAFSSAIVVLWWMRVTIHRAQHPHESWVGPAIATAPLLYSIWIQFRRPKSPPTPKDKPTTIDA
jgi:hypothetical protein